MTTPTRSDCSEPGPRTPGPMITVEGMPGAGKSTALSRLGARGPVLGEYTSLDGTPCPGTPTPTATRTTPTRTTGCARPPRRAATWTREPPW
ncbi:hypothetical protein KGD82_16175 [Nocardiopsis eucommiae]|uniref:Uncharacterized protein n=1 Tax=Nocardiopsis eucommiae TaxID=2831970 RepID=A0A975L742_9ACTN|nr:hypothetical protein KGD82_16175 [Nocardiopsis eucommiae]